MTRIFTKSFFRLSPSDQAAVVDAEIRDLESCLNSDDDPKVRKQISRIQRRAVQLGIWPKQKHDAAFFRPKLTPPEVELDFSLESLKYVDDVLENMRKRKHEPTPECLTYLGHYVGEVLIRQTGGRWVTDDQAKMGDCKIVEIPDFGYANPIGKCWKRLNNGATDGVEFYCRIVVGMQERTRQENAEKASTAKLA
jgi:hypothetical protein